MSEVGTYMYWVYIVKIVHISAGLRAILKGKSMGVLGILRCHLPITQLVFSNHRSNPHFIPSSHSVLSTDWRGLIKIANRSREIEQCYQHHLPNIKEFDRPPLFCILADDSSYSVCTVFKKCFWNWNLSSTLYMKYQSTESKALSISNHNETVS